MQPRSEEEVEFSARYRIPPLILPQEDKEALTREVVINAFIHRVATRARGDMVVSIETITGIGLN